VNVNGVVSGSFALHIRASNLSGTSEFNLTQDNTYSQPTQIEYGTVIVTGSQPASDFTLQGYSSSDRSRLRGTGSVGAVSVEQGGSETKTVAPGTTASTGTLHTKSFSLKDPPNAGAGYAGNHGVLSIRLNGTGTGAWDQVAATGTVDITNATLDVVQWFTPADGDSFTIVVNDGADAVTGTFRVGGVPVPQLGTFVTGGRTFQLNYLGGDGNDVVLTAVPQQPVSLQAFEVE
jgi:fibronectin-binding autotransporter adhesin